MLIESDVLKYEKQVRKFMFDLLDYIFRMGWCRIIDITRVLELNIAKLTGFINALIVLGYLKFRKKADIQVTLDLAGAIWLKMNKKLIGSKVEDLEIQIKNLRNGID